MEVDVSVIMQASVPEVLVTHETVGDSKVQSINKVMDIPIAQQRQLSMDTLVGTFEHQVPMVQQVWTTHFAPQLQSFDEAALLPVVAQFTNEQGRLSQRRGEEGEDRGGSLHFCAKHVL